MKFKPFGYFRFVIVVYCERRPDWLKFLRVTHSSCQWNRIRTFKYKAAGHSSVLNVNGNFMPRVREIYDLRGFFFWYGPARTWKYLLREIDEQAGSYNLHATELTVIYFWYFTVIDFPWIFVCFSLCSALLASCLRFMHRKAQPRGGIKSMETISPYSPNVSDKSCSWTSFERCPTHKVVLHTVKKKRKGKYLNDTRKISTGKRYYLIIKNNTRA